MWWNKKNQHWTIVECSECHGMGVKAVNEVCSLCHGRGLRPEAKEGPPATNYSYASYEEAHKALEVR